MQDDAHVDYFVSHAGPDAAWAAWIDQTLRNAGFTTITDLYDFTVGRNFILLMDEALRRADRVLLVWSPRAHGRYMVEAEWTSALVSRRDRLVPVIVEASPVPPILSPVLHIDLSECTDSETAARRLLEGLSARGRPVLPVAFPVRESAAAASVDQQPPLRSNGWSAARVGTRLLRTDKLVVSMDSRQIVLSVEPDRIRVDNKKVDARRFRNGSRYRMSFDVVLDGATRSVNLEFAVIPVTKHLRVVDLEIDGRQIAIVDRR